ncbi:hypothetical protein JQC91_16725 [Jannaschia sp. Os4]|uniref:hypothetical protein n=1 Tax=Jannaschia sp. Os4 TaxID=2807617 RepID=UPI001939565B|nr:hypothetical protein [Jannaschia sp. Os4]MBM2577952.1 hypothetical protein [Jannaschia sp. Os4]
MANSQDFRDPKVTDHKSGSNWILWAALALVALLALAWLLGWFGTDDVAVAPAADDAVIVTEEADTAVVTTTAPEAIEDTSATTTAPLATDGDTELVPVVPIEN